MKILFVDIYCCQTRYQCLKYYPWAKKISKVNQGWLLFESDKDWIKAKKEYYERMRK